jgi:hypothetical protein
MKLIQCSECGEVIMKLAKGSEIKPDIYSSHEVCHIADSGNMVNGAEDFDRKMKSSEMFNKMFGGVFE